MLLLLLSATPLLKSFDCCAVVFCSHGSLNSHLLTRSPLQPWSGPQQRSCRSLSPTPYVRSSTSLLLSLNSTSMQPALHKRIGSAKGALNHSCFANLIVRVFLSHRTLTPLVRVIARVAIINQSAPFVPILLTFLLLISFAYHCTTFSFEHFS